MIRLSRRGWNNVLIFATLLLILLFNQSGQFLDDAPPVQSGQLLPDGLPVMKMDFGGHQLERIGPGWRLRPSTNASAEQLSEVVNNWQQAIAEPLGPGKLADGLVAVIWLAGEEQGRVFELSQREEGIWLEHRQQLYLLPDQHLSAFVPDGAY
ncbi:hypothetical protein [Bowmanella dokdonensis]|uniref:Uncharacterized protein n=1 Tax=Bowmanella dokdonensis TaxID=751969 RepID=A0A939DRK9_9ALTE|nr:hypothetical protein [Bowmanella dokdonensis]MBN7827689.1 hypothetical protein [Bowmanella dokdonensis]